MKANAPISSRSLTNDEVKLKFYKK